MQRRNPYAEARARQFNLRLLDPVNDRYKSLLHELADQGVRTSFTELVHALLHEGPQNTDEARELLRRWRRLTAEPSSNPTGPGLTRGAGHCHARRGVPRAAAACGRRYGLH